MSFPTPVKVFSRFYRNSGRACDRKKSSVSLCPRKTRSLLRMPYSCKLEFLNSQGRGNDLMSRQSFTSLILGILFSGTMLSSFPAVSLAQTKNSEPQMMPTGQTITPLAPTGAKFSQLNPGLKDFPGYTVGQAIKTVISPDGNTLLSGERCIFENTYTELKSFDFSDINN